MEAELLELKANPNRKSKGTVVEAFLDKGRGYVSTILVQTGTLRIGDYILAGKHSGKIKAMFDERGNHLETAPSSTPVSILGWMEHLRQVTTSTSWRMKRRPSK